MFTYYGTSKSLVDIKVEEFGIVFEFVYLGFLILLNSICLFFYGLYRCFTYFSGKTLVSMVIGVIFIFLILFIGF